MRDTTTTTANVYIPFLFLYTSQSLFLLAAAVSFDDSPLSYTAPSSLPGIASAQARPILTTPPLPHNNTRITGPLLLSADDPIPYAILLLVRPRIDGTNTNSNNNMTTNPCASLNATACSGRVRGNGGLATFLPNPGNALLLPFQLTAPFRTPFMTAILFFTSNATDWSAAFTYPLGQSLLGLPAPRLPPGTACTPVTVAPSNVDACIYCAQGTPLPLPSEGAHYVWTDSWFTSLACEWRCDPGRDTDETDGTCPAHVYPPFLWFLPAVAALGMGVLMVGLLFFCARHTAAVAPIGMMTEEEEGMPDNGTLIRRSEGVIRLKMP